VWNIILSVDVPFNKRAAGYSATDYGPWPIL
jgi:hypothetical protein